MKIKLLNSTMMPDEGVYHSRRITEGEFVSLLQSNEFESFVGYEATAKFIEQLSGVSVPQSRGKTTLDDGDIILVARLNFRFANPKLKAERTYVPKKEDYEYFLVEYTKDVETWKSKIIKQTG